MYKNGGIKMKNVKKIISAALITIFATSLIGCNMIEKTPEGIAKTVVAKVFDTKVTKGEVDVQMTAVIQQFETQYGADYKSNPEAMQQLSEQKTQVLEGLIVEKIINYKAAELKVMPTEAKLNEEINKQLTEIKKSLETDEKYKEALTKANLTEDQLKARIKPSVIQDALHTEITKGVKTDETKEKEYYNSNLTLYTEKPNRVNVAHILVATEEEALAIKKSLDAGGDFAALAKAKSTDTGTKDKGGELGFIDYNDTQMDKTFMTAAITLPKGGISAPIKTQYGFHIIKAIAKEEFPVKKFETVKAEIEKTLIAKGKETLWTETMKKWQTEGKVTKYEDKL
jgi:foldase protein PrsA